MSAFSNPLLSGLVGDAEISALFTAEAEIGGLLAFEAALARAEAAEGVIPAAAGDAIVAAIETLRPDVPALVEGVARDGVIIPELVRQIRAHVGAPHDAHVHFGATSQDVIDTSLALRLNQLAAILATRIDDLVDDLDALCARDGRLPVMAHTRMQAAIPVTASRKILSWRDPLARQRLRLDAALAEVALLQFGGAAGTLEKFRAEAHAVGLRMAGQLGLALPERPRHNERDGLVGFAGWLSELTGSLGKMGQDIALMAQSEVGEVRLASGGGSSAMPHKVNPVGAEILVTLARFNATLVSGMHQSLVHENERSGAAWTLEWLLLPQMAVAAGAALQTADRLIAGLTFTVR